MFLQIHPYAKMVWSVLSVIPKVCPLSHLKIFYSYVRQAILDQVERDENIKMLLEDIRDVFDLGKLGHSLKTIKSDSKQAQTCYDTSATAAILSSRMESTRNSVCLLFPSHFSISSLETNLELEVYHRERQDTNRGLPGHALPAARHFPFMLWLPQR